ncbi:MAG: Gfo/Idh/MocA family oxidoreductase [Bacteroidales bacterium]|nr:Gfo/Idh/MocA family oxidoreductase [Bacteroidales bacterium]
MDKIRIAIIGTGYIADYHARGLQQLADVEIVIAVDTQLESAKKFTAKYNIKEVGSDAMNTVDRDDIDALVIGIPNKYHAPYAIEFLKSGKDVFLEKPMAMNSWEGNEIIEAIRATKQLLMVGHMWRFDTEVNHIRKVVQSGKLGKIIKTKGYGIHENWGPSGWFTLKEMAGGGALADMGVHAIDTVRYILGDPEPVTVYAQIGTNYGDYDVDDSGIIIITWDNGTTSIIESGWWHPHMDGPEAGTRLFGTKGYASVFPTFLKYKVEEIPGEFKAPMPERSEHCDQVIYDRQMEHFIDCIRSRKQPSPGFTEGQIVLNIVDAAYMSSQKNEVVTLK